MGLGTMPKKTAEQFRVKFEELLGVQRGGGSVPLSLTEWVDTVDPELRTSLEKLQLVPVATRMTLNKFLEEFRDGRKGLSPASLIRDRQVSDLLIERFGSDRSLGSIGPKDAEQFVQWLKTDGNKRDKNNSVLADNTVRRRTGAASQMFAKAIKWKLIKENPFDDMPTSVSADLERRAFIPWSSMLRIIDVCPTQEWRAFLAFVRLIGCRVPSEIHGLTWSDIDFVAKRIRIRSPKTKHHGGEHAVRFCPLFPELVPFLEDLSDLVGVGLTTPFTSPVFPVVGRVGYNASTHFARLIGRAGLEPWEKLFVNLRSSRETELLETYPVGDVCRWMGNSPAVAAKFYVQARTEIADRASLEETVGKSISNDGKKGSKFGPVAVERGSKFEPFSDHQEATKSKQNTEETLENSENQGILNDSVGAYGVSDGAIEWTILDSNQRPPRCQRTDFEPVLCDFHWETDYFRSLLTRMKCTTSNTKYQGKRELSW